MRQGRKFKPQNYDAIVATPIGRVGIVVQDGALVDVNFLGQSAALQAPRTDMARRTCRQIRSYFGNPRYAFRISLKLSGTPFQERVWRALQRIPVGKTLSYGALARKLDTSARAVGNACRANPVPIIVPCHRVVASNGMGGFMGKRSGAPLNLKQWLLEHERQQ